MQLQLNDDPNASARQLADQAAAAIRAALDQRARATVVLATGVSQFAVLRQLAQADRIDWSRVTVFHLDEYIGLAPTHPASFRRYLHDRFLAHVGAAPEFIAIGGDAPGLARELERLNRLLAARVVDLCLAGLGENGHLAFNDPPADFETDTPYLVVQLADACRRQQTSEGWFASLEDVPRRAISMSIRQIMRSSRLLLTASGARKAAAVRCMVQGPVDPLCPASILQRHPDCTVYLDAAAASALAPRPGPEG